jgi:hypothetical protein
MCVYVSVCVRAYVCVCLCVIKEPHKLGNLGPIWAVAPQQKKYIIEQYYILQYHSAALKDGT